jgi:putative resolvase
VEHRDRLSCFGARHLQAALAASGTSGSRTTTNDLVGDITEVATFMCARLPGQRAAKNRAVSVIAVATGEGAA